MTHLTKLIITSKKNREMLKEFLISYFIKKNKISYNKQNEFLVHICQD